MMLTKTNNVTDAAKILLEKTTAIFAITIGAEGTMFGFKNAITIIPSIPITPTDTTGAGDAFVGALLYQLSNKTLDAIHEMQITEWEKLILNANKAGARTCEYLGAMEAFKHLNKEILN
jgi:fructokinase